MTNMCNRNYQWNHQLEHTKVVSSTKCSNLKSTQLFVADKTAEQEILLQSNKNKSFQILCVCYLNLEYSLFTPRVNINPKRTKVFFETKGLSGGGHFDPLLTQKPKKLSMKLCTVIVYDILSITKQLKFLNSHCSSVCIHCSIVCLITKNG